MMFCELNLLSNAETKSAKLCEFGLVEATLWRRCEFDVAIITLQKSCQCKIQCTPFHLELKLLSNVEITLEQRWNFDVVAPTSLQRFVLVLRCYNLITTLSQRCVFAGSFHEKQSKQITVKQAWYNALEKNFHSLKCLTKFETKLCHTSK